MIFVLVNARRIPSVLSLAEQINVSKNTANYMAMRVRHFGISIHSIRGKLNAIVEARCQVTDEGCCVFDVAIAGNVIGRD